MDFPRQDGAVRSVRDYVAKRMGGIARFDRVEDAVLAVSELATNVVMHTTVAVMVVLIRETPHHVRVEVIDGAPANVEAAAPDLDGENGRGLAIVMNLADRYGRDRTQGCSWVEFDLLAAS